MLCQIIAPQKTSRSFSFALIRYCFCYFGVPFGQLTQNLTILCKFKQLRCDYALYAHTSQGLVNVCFANNAQTGHNELEEFWKTSWFLFFLVLLFLFICVQSKEKKKYISKINSMITGINICFQKRKCWIKMHATTIAT